MIVSFCCTLLSEIQSKSFDFSPNLLFPTNVRWSDGGVTGLRKDLVPKFRKEEKKGKGRKEILQEMLAKEKKKMPGRSNTSVLSEFLSSV